MRIIVMVVTFVAVACSVVEAKADTFTVQLGQTVELRDGDYYEQIIIENGGIFIMNGGAVGTNEHGNAASVDVKPGGRFVMNAGEINYFNNRGVAEIYGGQAIRHNGVAATSVNLGYLKIAGGDIGWQVFNGGDDAILDLFYYSSKKESIEVVIGGNAITRIHSVSNTLEFGEHSFSELDLSFPVDSVAIHSMTAELWSPGGSYEVSIEILSMEWPEAEAQVVSSEFREPQQFASEIDPAVMVSWNGEVGRTYQVQSTTNLTENVWVNVGLPVHASTENNYTLDTTKGASRKTYRVILRK